MPWGNWGQLDDLTVHCGPFGSTTVSLLMINSKGRVYMRTLPKSIAVLFIAISILVSIAGGSATGAPPDMPSDLSRSQVAYTKSELETLQAEVDKHLNNYGGGKQISINQVSYEDGQMILTLPLPGETKARGLDEPVTPLGTANCAGLSACLWSDTNFNGQRISREPCQRITLAAPFNSSVGSIHNNQSNGTQTILFNSSGQILNANMAPSRINDTGVGTRFAARSWQVCP